MNVYIQREAGHLPTEMHHTAWLGVQMLNKLGNDDHRVRFFEDIEDVPLSPDNLVVAYIEDTHWYLEQLNVAIPLPMNIPTILIPYAGRRFKTCTLRHLKDGVTLPVFVKPASEHKLFSGGVVSNRKDIDLTLNYPDSTLVLWSEVVDMRSEYRVFVCNGEILPTGVRHYKGNPLMFPDGWDIQEMVRLIGENPEPWWTEVPRSYTLDVAVAGPDDTTIVVEANDGYACSPYGLDPVQYVRFLKARWFQLTKSTRYGNG